MDFCDFLYVIVAVFCNYNRDFATGGNMNELREKLINRMEKEKLNVSEVSNITGLNRKTLQRFLYTSTNISKSTSATLSGFVDYPGKYKEVEEMINVGQVRIPKAHYEYLKRHAEEDGVSVIEVLRRVVENVVENDYLWKSFDEHLNITERSLKTTMSKTMIPFIRQQDKEIAFIGNYVMYLEELIFRLCSKDHSDKEFRKSMKVIKDSMFEIGDNKRYKRTKKVD